jgi:hypothetical protein
MIQRQQQRNAAVRAVSSSVVLEKGIIAKVVVKLGGKRKPTQRPSSSKGNAWVSREFLSSISSPNQRSMSGNSSTSAAARMSQQKQQA